MKIQNKNIVVTGATGGIGRELVKELAKEGANIILLSHSYDELKHLSKDLGCEYDLFAVDFSDQGKTEDCVKKIADKYKKIDILINAAGVGVYKFFKDITLDDWNKSLDVNLTSQFIVIKGLIKRLKVKSGGLVINIGSGAGVIPMAQRSLYCASKFALRGFTLSLAKEYKRSNVEFCLITLGSVLTSFGPLTVEEKKKEMALGKAYFTPEWVAKKLIEITKDEDRDLEYTLFPSGYATSWKKTS